MNRNTTKKAVVFIVAFALLFVIGCSSKQSESELLEAATQSQADGRIIEAINHYASVVEYYPDGEHAPKSQFMIGFLYANELEDTASARMEYQRFLDLYAGKCDSTMILSAKWELQNLGRDVDDLEGVFQTH